MIKKLILASSLLVTSVFSAEYPADTKYTNNWAKRLLNNLPFDIKIGVTDCKELEEKHNIKARKKINGFAVYCNSNSKVGELYFGDSKYDRKLKPFYIGLSEDLAIKRLKRYFKEEDLEIEPHSPDVEVFGYGKAYLTDYIVLTIIFQGEGGDILTMHIDSF
jgi:hypothetical protein